MKWRISFILIARKYYKYYQTLLPAEFQTEANTKHPRKVSLVSNFFISLLKQARFQVYKDVLGSGLNVEIAKKQAKICPIWFCKKILEGNKFKRRDQKQFDEILCQEFS